MCKHLLASRLCEKLQACKFREVDDEQLIAVLRGYTDEDEPTPPPQPQPQPHAGPV